MIWLATAQDKKLAWYDLDLSTKPYRSLRYHEKALRGVAYHARHPLFASASDDGALHVFHGMVYQVRVAGSVSEQSAKSLRRCCRCPALRGSYSSWCGTALSAARRKHRSVKC